MPRIPAPMRAGFTGIILGLTFAASARAADLSPGERALLQGRAVEATAILRSAISASPGDGHAHLLLCRVFYSELLVDSAIHECEAAIGVIGNNSEAQDWMGRVYGLKAGHVGPISGFSLARKVRAAFEASVNLNPGNGEAFDDLGEYYIEAPSIVGGGIDKAVALAQRFHLQHPQRSLRLQAMVAEKNKDYGTAERNYRSCVSMTGGRPDTWVDLGNFYGRQKKLDNAVDAFQQSLNANRTKDSSLVAVATSLQKIDREPALAEQALQVYLSGGNWDDSAPTFKAHTLLAGLMAARGDKDLARTELNKALALAPDYAPAKKAMASL